MSAANIQIFFARNAIKEAFLKRNRITTTLPAIEYLIASLVVKSRSNRDFFTVQEVQEVLKQNLLPHHEQTVYRTSNYLLKAGYIQVMGGRQYFKPQHFYLTSRGVILLRDFSSFITHFQ